MTDQIARLGVDVGANTAQFDAGMKRVRKNANTTASSIKSSFANVGKGLAGGLAAGLSVGLLSTGIKAALDYAGSLGEVSQQLGVTTKDLQVLRFAAGQTGISQEELDKGLGKLTITLGQVAAGAKAPAKALAAIGITTDELKGKDTGAAFRMIADGLAKIPDRAQRAAVEVALFGRTGAKLDTVLSGGSKAINELSMAAERLGIVLSDRQIQQADETADKLDAVKTVLAAQISGVVANNAQSILSLSSALASLTSSIVNFLGSNPTAALAILGGIAGSRFGVVGAASGAFAGAVAGGRMSASQQAANLTGGGASKELLRYNLDAERKRLKAKRAAGQPIKQSEVDRLNRLNNRVQTAYGIAQPAPTGATVAPFLASGGGGGGGGGSRKVGGGRDTSKDAERARLDALRDAYRFDEDSRRADMDILQAKQALAPTYIERAALDIEMLNKEKESYEAELAYQVATGEISKTQADKLKLKYDENDALRRQAVLAEEEEERQRTYNALDDKDFEIKQDILQKQAGLADTAGERRKLELEMLQLEYDHRKMVLERIMRESKDYAEIESARRELANLPTNQALDRQGVMKSTQGPMESYLATLPSDAAKMNEALEQVKVNGLQGLEDGILNVITGVQSLGEAFKQVASQIIADLLRIMIQKTIVNALGMAMGGPPGMGAAIGGGGGATIPGFATGGSFNVMGNHGTDRNTLSLNGLPIAKVSHGERVNVSNDNASGGGMVFSPTIHVSGPISDPRKTGLQIAAAMRSEISRAGRKGY